MPIEVAHLSHIYGKGTPFAVEAVKDVSFTLQDGEFLGIIGHTGSGKSTLAPVSYTHLPHALHRSFRQYIRRCSLTNGTYRRN